MKKQIRTVIPKDGTVNLQDNEEIIGAQDEIDGLHIFIASNTDSQLANVLSTELSKEKPVTHPPPFTPAQLDEDKQH